jgi:hypothetical protein
MNEIGQLTRRETAAEGEAGTSPSTQAGTGVVPPGAEEAGEIVAARATFVGSSPRHIRYAELVLPVSRGGLRLIVPVLIGPRTLDRRGKPARGSPTRQSLIRRSFRPRAREGPGFLLVCQTPALPQSEDANEDG